MLPNQSLLFNYETQTKTDFRNVEIKPIVKTTYKKPKDACYRIKPPGVKYIHTLSEWRVERYAPMGLFIKTKEPVRTNPWKPQERFDKPVDLEKEAILKSRPRLVITPAISLDDLKDPQARQQLCDDVYTSMMTRGIREGLGGKTERPRVEAPFPGLPAAANMMSLPKLRPPYVSPEWRMDTITWDGQQLRFSADATEAFWLNRKGPRCRMCDETAIMRDHRKMKLVNK